VRIYDEALSKKQVQEISKGLILHYTLNNYINNFITDVSGNGYTGTIGGALTFNNDSPRYNKSTQFNGSS
jgi:hypothetical protein